MNRALLYVAMQIESITREEGLLLLFARAFEDIGGLCFTSNRQQIRGQSLTQVVSFSSGAVITFAGSPASTTKLRGLAPGTLNVPGTIRIQA